jgi:hypothetical protein
VSFGSCVPDLLNKEAKLAEEADRFPLDVHRQHRYHQYLFERAKYADIIARVESRKYAVDEAIVQLYLQSAIQMGSMHRLPLYDFKRNFQPLPEAQAIAARSAPQATLDPIASSASSTSSTPTSSSPSSSSPPPSEASQASPSSSSSSSPLSSSPHEATQHTNQPTSNVDPELLKAMFSANNFNNSKGPIMVQLVPLPKTFGEKATTFASFAFYILLFVSLIFFCYSSLRPSMTGMLFSTLFFLALSSMNLVLFGIQRLLPLLNLSHRQMFASPM